MDHGVQYRHLHLSFAAPGVLEVRLNRPHKRNAFDARHWQELGHAFARVIPRMRKARCVLLTGAGPIFSAGIDLASMAGGIGGAVTAGISIGDGEADEEEEEEDAVVARAAAVLREGGYWQASWKALSDCRKPVVCAIHGGCYGAALELVCYADVRFCTRNCVFAAPEVDLGFAADIGGNQLFPKIVGNQSYVRELQLSGRTFGADEALRMGLVSRILPGADELRAASCALAESIAKKSPVATMGVKTMLNYARDHSLEDSLAFSLTWNAAMIQTRDTARAGMAFVTKTEAVFPDAPVLVKDASDNNDGVAPGSSEDEEAAGQPQQGRKKKTTETKAKL